MTEDEYREVFQKVKETRPDLVESTADKFERAADLFGYRKMFRYKDREGLSFHDATYELGRVCDLCELSGLDANTFYANILDQVRQDTQEYEEGTAHHSLNAIVTSLNTNIPDVIEEAKKHSDIGRLQELAETLKRPEDVFASWGNLKRYRDLSRLLDQTEILDELKSLTDRAMVMFMKYRHTYEEGERRELVKAIRELERAKSLDNATIWDVIDKVAPVLEKLGKEKRKQEAEQSVRSDLRQIERMLVREESDSFENFRESLIEVKAVMEGGYVDGARKQLDLLHETDEYQALLSRREEREQEEEVSKLLFGESRMVRDYILESQGKLPLSKEKFDRYFSSKDFDISADLKQQNVGDCYLIAAIHAMSRSPNFELFCRSSMERLHDGSWRVKIPLLSEDGEWITVTKEEILPQKNENFLNWRSDTGGLDMRRWLQPVQGKEGLQVLEAAYIKKRFSVVDRLAAESGYGGTALMLFGGDNFVRFEVDSQDSFLENFDPEIYMATVSSEVTNNSPHLLYKGSMTGEPLVPRHAYSIAGVNAEERTITLANPWDTSRPIEMSFDQFKENFCQFGVARIDNANLLLNMREVGRETGNIQ